MKVRDKEITRGVKSQVGGRVETGGEGALDSSGCDFDDRAGASGSVRGKQIARAVKGQAPRKRQPGGEDTGGPSRGNFYNPVAEKVRVVEVPQGSETVNWNRGRCQTGNDREGDEGELRFSCGAHSGELFLEV